MVNAESLIDVIKSRDLARFEPYLTSGIDLSAPLPVKSKTTPFELAVQYRADEIAAALVKAGVKPPKKSLNLVWAVCTRDPEIVRLFIGWGADVNRAAIMGSPLVVAAQWGLAEIVEILIAGGADMNAKSIRGTPLRLAVENKHTDAALALIKAGAHLDPEEHLLVTAVDASSVPTVEALLAAGAHPNERADVTRWDEARSEHVTVYSYATPLIVAAAEGWGDLSRLLVEAKADPHLTDAQGLTALDWARKSGHENLVELLEAAMAGAPRQIPPEDDLLLASQMGDLDRVKDLLKAGADPNARDNRPKSSGFTPLMHAAANGHAGVVAALLEAGADHSLKDDTVEDSARGFSFVFNEGGAEMVREAGFQMHRTALGWAAEGGHDGVRCLLVQRGAEVDALDRAKLSPLMIAASSGSVVMVRGLLADGADVNLRSRGKQTALILAAERGHAEIVSALADAGAKLDLKDRDGYTALLYAASKASPATVAALLEAGADVHTTSSIGRTALHQPLGTTHLLKDYVDGETIVRYGCYVYTPESLKKDRLSILPTTERNEVIAIMQTNGANFGIMPEDIAGWLTELDQAQPFVLTGIGFDFLSGYFKSEISEPRKLAKRMYEFCPDIVDQGCGDVKSLAAELKRSRRLYFWWD